MLRKYGTWAGGFLIVLGLVNLLVPNLTGRLGLHAAGALTGAYLLSGIALLSTRLTQTGERLAAQIVGLGFTLIALLGLTGGGAILGTVPVTTVSNSLHLVIGVLGQYAGFGKTATKRS